MSGTILGIDLGTVNSCVAAVQEGRAVVLGEEGERIVPSCISFQEGKEVIGSAARRCAVTDPANTISAVKRLMGHAYDSPEVQAARERTPYSIGPSPLGSVLLEVAGHEMTPVQVSAKILQRVRAVAEKALGEPVRRAVISVPAHFNDVQRKATKMAAEHAGLEVVRLINEPTAAAFAYGYRQGEDFTLAVYDLGGGTFDITLMTGKGDTFEVDATDGDSYLGGEDFDRAIVDWLFEEFERQYGVDIRGDETAVLRLKEVAERAKVELSEVEEAQIELPFLAVLPDGERPHFARSLSRAKLTDLVQPLIDRTLDLCRQCLQAAGLVVADVSDVLLVGGQTRMPQVRDAMRELFDREPRRDINPDEVVAMGAALFGYSLIADDLKEEAVDAAGEAYAVAFKEMHVARRVLDEVIERVQPQMVKDLDAEALADRLSALLKESEKFVSSAEEAPPIDESDLPTAAEDMRDELMEIDKKVCEVVKKVQGGLEEAELPDRWTELDEARSGFSERLSAAQEMSEEIQTQLAEANSHEQARRVDLIDVTSRALGIKSAGDIFSVLIQQNTKIPAEHVRAFSTNQDGQTEVELRIIQGSEQRASENQELGSFVLEGIAPAPRMQPKIDVTFSIDENGILDVCASDANSGVAQSIRVEGQLALGQEDPP
jgi:molecular chaperone DnaK (HSP70)